MIQIIQKIPLVSSGHQLYTGAMKKDCGYDFLCGIHDQIDIFDDCLQIKTCICNHEGYETITNTSNGCFFYTTKYDDFDHLYIVDNQYHEVAYLTLKIADIYKQPIQNIAYDEVHKQILIVLKDIIYSVTSDGHFIKEVLNSCYMSSMVEGSCPTCSFAFTAIQICGDCFYVTYCNQMVSCVCELSFNMHLISKGYLDDCVVVEAIMVVNNYLQLLVCKQEQYNYMYITDLACINHEVEECIDCEGDVVLSIAYMETALAHILNAEGEKIQKAIELANTVCELIKVNDSVNKTIMNITMLEQTLLAKLQLVEESKFNCSEENDT